MIVVYVICLVALVAAAGLVLIRVERGPSMLDRAIALDVVTAALIGFIAVYSVAADRSDLLPIMAALALVGFISTVTISRFVAFESTAERHILTAAELEELGNRVERLADDAAPVHDVDALAEGSDTPAEAAAAGADVSDAEVSKAEVNGAEVIGAEGEAK